MLSLFRHTTRCSAVAHAARPLAAYYSDVPEFNVDGMREAQALVEDVAQEKEKSFAGGYKNSRGQEVKKWKPFRSGDVVKPHDFTYKARFNAPPTFYKRRPVVGPPPSKARFSDVFHQFDIDPVSLSMNREILSAYVSEMGKIHGRNITELTSKSQRRMGKAIRRAKMMGIIPVHSRATGLMSIYHRP